MYENIGIDAARLNPYYTGIHLHITPKSPEIKKELKS